MKDRKEYFKEYFKKYWVKNKDKLKEQRKEYLKEYRLKHRDKSNKYSLEYYLKHKDTFNEYSKRWVEQNPEKRREVGRKYFQRHKKEYIEYAKHKNKTDLKFNLNNRIRKAIGISLRGNKNGRHWEDLVGYTFSRLIKRLETTMPKRYLWKDYLEGKLVVDHIIPIKAFIFKSPEDEEFKDCWSLENLRLLPAKENGYKSDKITNPILLGLLIKYEGRKTSCGNLI